LKYFTYFASFPIYLKALAIENAQKGNLIAVVVLFVICREIVDCVINGTMGDGRYIPKRLRRCWKMKSVAKLIPWCATVAGRFGKCIHSINSWANKASGKAQQWRLETQPKPSKYNRKIRRSPHKINLLHCFMASTSSLASRTGANGNFQMVVDPGCSYCMTNDKSHFVSDVRAVSTKVTGISGHHVQATLRGTVKWSFKNDLGQLHDEYITNVYYNSECPYCLYSPQHVAQIAKDNHPVPKGTYSVFYDDSMELVWDQRSQTRTVPIDQVTNTFIMTAYATRRGFAKFNKQVDSIKNYNAMIRNPSMTILAANVIEEDDSIEDQENSSVTSTIIGVPVDPKLSNGRAAEVPFHPDLPNTIFDPTIENTHEGSHIIPIEDEEIQAQTPQAMMLAWHYRLGHIPFGKIKQLAKRGDLPSKLATCDVPNALHACMERPPDNRGEPSHQ
jgi:hypothetical protein